MSVTHDANSTTEAVAPFLPKPTLPPRPPDRNRPSGPSPDPNVRAVSFDDPFVRALNAASLRAADPPKKQRGIKIRRRSFGQWMMLRAIISLVVLGGAGAIGGISRLVGDHATGPAYPDQWDVRVTQYVDFVEEERGLTFDHPVYVDFLTEDDFLTLFEPDDSGSGGNGASDEADAIADLTDAAGLSTSFDPVADEATVSRVSTLGFYSPSADRIVVRGDDLTPPVQSVLVHELTHALQHQHFDVQTGGADDLEVRSIVEADAMRIEDAYLATLGQFDRGVAIEQNTDDGSMDAALSGVPWAIVDKNQAPYILGPIFLDRVIQNLGAEAVNQVFGDIPTSKELIEPDTYRPQVHSPRTDASLPVGLDLVDVPTEWSMYDALVMLDAWLPWSQSRSVLDGWVTGERTSFTPVGQDGAICFTASVQFETAEQATAYATALTSWAAAAGSAAVPNVAARIARFEACPRTSGVDPPVPALMPSEELYLENLLVGAIDTAGPATSGDPWYTCVARALVDDPTFTSLAFTEVLTDEQNAAIVVAGDTARWVCGAAPVV